MKSEKLDELEEAVHNVIAILDDIASDRIEQTRAGKIVETPEFEKALFILDEIGMEARKWYEEVRKLQVVITR